MNRIAWIIAITGLVLLIPFIAMQFTGEVNWSPFDFLAAGILLLGTGFLCELVFRKTKSPRHRIFWCAVIALVLLLTWLELAVGIFGSPWAGH